MKYHPDKTGCGEEDEVFVNESGIRYIDRSYETTSYDSTMDFDESIPKEGVTEEDFYKEYGPAFERNLRFASCNDPMKQSGKKDDSDGAPKKKGKNKNKKNRNSVSQSSSASPPAFGDDSTPLTQVHAFYDFWVHFDSWRDFTLKAAEEAEHDVESADCREEKRWMKSEIDRKMKKMKKDEMARVNLLVERAMGVDPRLKKEKKRLAAEKKQKEQAKKKADTEKAEKEKKDREKMEKEMATKKAEEGM